MTITNLEVSNTESWIPVNNIDEALLYCFFLRSKGKNGWRLPTNIELGELYNANILPLPFRHFWAADDEVLYPATLQVCAVRACDD